MDQMWRNVDETDVYWFVHCCPDSNLGVHYVVHFGLYLIWVLWRFFFGGWGFLSFCFCGVRLFYLRSFQYIRSIFRFYWSHWVFWLTQYFFYSCWVDLSFWFIDRLVILLGGGLLCFFFSVVHHECWRMDGRSSGLWFRIVVFLVG